MSTNIKLNNSQQLFKVITLLYGYYEDIPYLSINKNENILTLKKELSSEETKVKNEWKFYSDRFYKTPDLNSVFINEIANKRYFFNFTKNYKGSLVLVTQSEDTFLNSNSPMFMFLNQCIREVFSECFGANFKTTISYSHIKQTSNQFMDIFDTDIQFNKKKFSSMNLIKSEEDDVKLKGSKEISMNSEDDFMSFIVLLEDVLKQSIKSTSLSNQLPKTSHLRKLDGFNFNNKQNSNVTASTRFTSNNKNANTEENFIHEIVTIRVYDKNKNFFSKFNFVLYKAFNLGDNVRKCFTNVKENSTFFNALIRNNYRDSKFTRLLQDTSEHNCFVINNLCVHYQFILILHDILNLIKQRQSLISIDCDFELEKEFEKLKILESHNNSHSIKNNASNRDSNFILSNNNSCYNNNINNDNNDDNNEIDINNETYNFSNTDIQNLNNINNNNEQNSSKMNFQNEIIDNSQNYSEQFYQDDCESLSQNKIYKNDMQIKDKSHAKNKELNNVYFTFKKQFSNSKALNNNCSNFNNNEVAKNKSNKQDFIIEENKKDYDQSLSSIKNAICHTLIDYNSVKKDNDKEKNNYYNDLQTNNQDLTELKQNREYNEFIKLHSHINNNENIDKSNTYDRLINNKVDKAYSNHNNQQIPEQLRCKQSNTKIAPISKSNTVISTNNQPTHFDTKQENKIRTTFIMPSINNENKTNNSSQQNSRLFNSEFLDESRLYKETENIQNTSNSSFCNNYETSNLKEIDFMSSSLNDRNNSQLGKEEEDTTADIHSLNILDELNIERLKLIGNRCRLKEVFDAFENN